MPKQTFFNLAADKRDLITRIAIDEFASSDYESASISNIVAQAGIAKGSFYQYFEDKLDLYQYLLHEGSRMKGEFLAAHPPTDDTSHPFVYLRWLLKVGLRFDFAHRKLAKIAQQAISGQGPFPAAWRREMETGALTFYQGIIGQGIEKGFLRADLDQETAAYLLHVSLRDMATYLLHRLAIPDDESDLVAAFAQHEAEVEAIFDRLFDTLERGMTGKP